jgi:hypothetical protein
MTPTGTRWRSTRHAGHWTVRPTTLRASGNGQTGLVSVGGLAAAFIGGLAVRDNAPLSVWTAVGILAFAALLAVAVFALWPRKFVFTQHSDQRLCPYG